MLEIHLPATLQVPGNRAYLYIIFFNLLLNSIKYRAEGWPLHVAITAHPGPNGVEVSVADNGPGPTFFGCTSASTPLAHRAVVRVFTSLKPP